ncbi:MAG: hotdog family protein [Hydrogenophaga sp.]|uniref:hotdog family protein n=1 Tax=Hydrogenophaga sp. TaxID=1904254 RepID=UPI002718B189|nr:hotdog family protein [Hydrogenophaga sp.]MDO9202010.1 hotdog family protein [Hydrogenophaga sp.]MDP3628937.1 hotdog family protein [Hydrogenophaga sp.]MDZ4101958.1 hotdog family protein [Hydrogenophaga sp.]MDZ4280706.1 hotdog family protein [Hydrogenophaga sp.]
MNPAPAPALDHAWIAARIPHQGSMCLLDGVVEWSADHIVCRALSHTDPAHPLRAAGRLGAANGIEYAAQAMAVHGALVAGASAAPRQGYLTSVRSVSLHAERLDHLPGPLSVRAERLSGDVNNVLYRFTLHHGEHCLLDGRAAVVLDADLL